MALRSYLGFKKDYLRIELHREVEWDKTRFVWFRLGWLGLGRVICICPFIAIRKEFLIFTQNVCAADHTNLSSIV